MAVATLIFLPRGGEISPATACAILASNAIDDLIFEILNTMSHLVIAGLRGNAGAGGAMLALAADHVYARSGVVLNPHYGAWAVSADRNTGPIRCRGGWAEGALKMALLASRAAKAVAAARLPAAVDSAAFLSVSQTGGAYGRKLC